MIVDWCQAARGEAACSESARVPGVADARRMWHVFQTRPRQEKVVAELLSGGGVEPFLPVVRRVMHYGHRRRIAEIPLFSGYLFVLGALEQAYAALAGRRAVRRLAVTDPARLAHELAQIRRAMRGDAGFSPYRYLEQGMRVRVASGPFKDVEGVVDRGVDDGRLVLQVQTLGRATSLEIDACLLVRIEDDKAKINTAGARRRDRGQQ
jgi:transcription antitermination factor NusG